MSRPETVVILAAGQGTRMKLGRPKVMAPLCGRPMIGWVVEQALGLDPERVLVVVGHGGDEVREAVASIDPRITCVDQTEQLGTGHALQMCLPELGPGEAGQGRVVLLYGDMPLLGGESLERLCSAQASTAGGMAMLTSRPLDPRGFGRIVRDDKGSVRAIVEEQDASPEQRGIAEVNLGVYCFQKSHLVRLLPRLSKDNAQGEYYVTDLVAMLVDEGAEVAAEVLDDETEAIGVNTLVHLAEARAELQLRILEGHMEAGVRIEDPATTYIDHGVEIGAGTEVLPCTVIRSGVRIGRGCRVGPFSHLRVDTEMGEGAQIGNFTEAKKSRLGAGSKALHLSYLGDATIGSGTNIGAGTVFANYDGQAKHPSTVGQGSFVGSGTIVVAPASIGDGATTGAGAVLTRGSEVPGGETWVGVPARPIRRRGERNRDGSAAGAG